MAWKFWECRSVCGVDNSDYVSSECTEIQTATVLIELPSRMFYQRMCITPRVESAEENHRGDDVIGLDILALVFW